MRFDGPHYDRYLGDGVYATYDGYHVILDLRAQDATTRIALEPQVMDSLNRYVADLAVHFQEPEPELEP